MKLELLLFLIVLSISCVERDSPQPTSTQPVREPFFTTDTLKFISGIRAIFQDSKRNYWFGSHQEGVARFDGKNYVYFTTEDGLAANQVRSIQEDAQGNVWFGTSNGVSKYNGKQIETITYLADVNPTQQWSKSEGDLWFNAGNLPGIYRVSEEVIDYLNFPITFSADRTNSYGVTDIAVGSNDMKWFATYSGVFGYDGKDFTTITDQSVGSLKSGGQLHVRSILEDSKGRLWIGNNGIGVLLKEKDSIINFSEKNNLLHPLSARNGNLSQPKTLEHVFAIEEDAKGNIWFADRDTGVWKYDGRRMKNYSIPGCDSQMVWCIYTDANNHLLIGSAEVGVYRLEEEVFVRLC